jgi:hypothetical protein
MPDHENDVGHLSSGALASVSAMWVRAMAILSRRDCRWRISPAQESRLICQGQFATDVREGLGVRRKTIAERVLQYLALVLFRFPHLYGRVMCGIGRLDQHKGGVVALVDDYIGRVVRRYQIIDGAQHLNHENCGQGLASGESITSTAQFVSARRTLFR